MRQKKGGVRMVVLTANFLLFPFFSSAINLDRYAIARVRASISRGFREV